MANSVLPTFRRTALGAHSHNELSAGHADLRLPLWAELLLVAFGSIIALSAIVHLASSDGSAFAPHHPHIGDAFFLAVMVTSQTALGALLRGRSHASMVLVALADVALAALFYAQY